MLKRLALDLYDIKSMTRKYFQLVDKKTNTPIDIDTFFEEVSNKIDKKIIAGDTLFIDRIWPFMTDILSFSLRKGVGEEAGEQFVKLPILRYAMLYTMAHVYIITGLLIKKDIKIVSIATDLTEEEKLVLKDPIKAGINMVEDFIDSGNTEKLKECGFSDEEIFKLTNENKLRYN